MMMMMIIIIIIIIIIIFSNNNNNNNNYGFVMRKFHMHKFRCAIQLLPILKKNPYEILKTTAKRYQNPFLSS